jgi:hypothetical protein
MTKQHRLQQRASGDLTWGKPAERLARVHRASAQRACELRHMSVIGVTLLCAVLCQVGVEVRAGAQAFYLLRTQRCARYLTSNIETT